MGVVEAVFPGEDTAGSKTQLQERAYPIKIENEYIGSHRPLGKF